MTPQQSQAAMQFYLGSVYPKRAAEAPLFEAFGADLRANPEILRRHLGETLDTRIADDVESLLVVSLLLGALTTDSTEILCRLLLADFHTRHEDIAKTLQELRDPRSVQALYDACFLDLPYFIDDGDALARKCTWALHDVGTEDAFEKLRLLCSHPRESVCKYAEKRL